MRWLGTGENVIPDYSRRNLQDLSEPCIRGFGFTNLWESGTKSVLQHSMRTILRIPSLGCFLGPQLHEASWIGDCFSCPVQEVHISVVCIVGSGNFDSTCRTMSLAWIYMQTFRCHMGFVWTEFTVVYLIHGCREFQVGTWFLRYG